MLEIKSVRFGQPLAMIWLGTAISGSNANETLIQCSCKRNDKGMRLINKYFIKAKNKD